MSIKKVQRAVALAVGCVTVTAACSDGISPDQPTEVQFVTVPVSMTVADQLAPDMAVSVRDARGNTVDWQGEVTVSLAGAGTLEGTTTQAARGGVAIFDDLRVTGTGDAYRLVARAGSLREDLSGPFDVHDVFQAEAVAVGRNHTCALAADGVAYCWGLNSSGQLGTGDTNGRSVPTQVQTDVRFASLATNTFSSHTCGVTQDAEVYCWGANGAGQVGDGSTSASRTVPTRVALPAPARTVTAGWFSSCAVLTDDSAWCWGSNFNGELGIGDVDESQPSPVEVLGGHPWALLRAGVTHTCGLTTSGEAYCWGDNRYGATGVGVSALDGPDYGRTMSPTRVLGDHTFTDLSAGGGTCSGSTCGITADGSVLCWGRHYQLGGTNRYIAQPTPMSWPTAMAVVALGNDMACGITADGTAHCSGSPLSIEPIGADVRVASLGQGLGHTCLTATDGRTFCWGVNGHGQLGSGDGAGWFGARGVWAP